MNSSAKHVAIVCNPEAGKGRALIIQKECIQALELEGIAYRCFQRPWPPGFDGFSSIWLIGGDGTLHYFLNQYPDLVIPIAVFKGGTGNDFAWKLYGNKSWNDYLQLAIHGIPRKVDAGMCNGKYFINGVGIGFDGAVVNSMGRKKWFRGHLAYLFSVLKHIFFYKEAEISVIAGDLTMRNKIFLISVANGSRFGGGFLVAPQAIIDDGLLDLIIIHQIAPLKRFFHLPKVEKGKHLSLPFVEVYKGTNFSISSSEKLPAHFDGEFMESVMFDIKIIPGKFLFYC